MNPALLSLVSGQGSEGSGLLQGLENIGSITKNLEPLFNHLREELKVNAAAGELFTAQLWIAPGVIAGENNLFIMPSVVREIKIEFGGAMVKRPVVVREMEPINLSALAVQFAPMLKAGINFAGMGKGV